MDEVLTLREEEVARVKSIMDEVKTNYDNKIKAIEEKHRKQMDSVREDILRCSTTSKTIYGTIDLNQIISKQASRTNASTSQERKVNSISQGSSKSGTR